MSAEVTEAFLEDIPASLSPIAAFSRTGSGTPPVDELELWASANKVLEDFLSTKAEPRRAMWELGVALCQSEFRAAKAIKEAKAASLRQPSMPMPPVPS